MQYTVERIRGPFLESPGNFSGPKSNIVIEIKRLKARVLASKLLHFVLVTDSFIKLDAQLLNFILHVINNSFAGPLIIATFEKRAPEIRKAQKV